MARVYLGLGSNVEPAKHICACLTELAQRFELIASSAVYQTPAVGFAGDDFLNAVVGIETRYSIDELRISLRSIEREHGRRRSQTEKFNSRTLDIDLLLYDEVVKQEVRYKLPHDDILRYAFVLYPLSEIVPERKHPVLQKTFKQLAAESTLDRQAMTEVRLDCGEGTVVLQPIQH